MNINLDLCIFSILLMASGGLTIGLSDYNISGAIVILAGAFGIFVSFRREYWRQVYSESEHERSIEEELNM